MREHPCSAEESGDVKSVIMEKARVVVPPPLISLLGVGVGVAAHLFLAPLTIPGLGAGIRVYCGVFLGLLGISAIALSFRHFIRTGQDPKPWTPTPAIIAEGIYRYSRNPMYLGLAMIQGGIGIGTNVLWIVLMIVPVLISLHFLAVLPEEHYLENKFGEEYLRYKSTVRRWI